MNNNNSLTVMLLLSSTLIGGISNTVAAESIGSGAISPSIEYASTYESKGLTMQAPKGWLFMSPSEVRKKSGGTMHIAGNSIFFVTTRPLSLQPAPSE